MFLKSFIHNILFCVIFYFIFAIMMLVARNRANVVSRLEIITLNDIII